MKNKTESEHSNLQMIRESLTSQGEYQLISEWLDSRIYHSIGAVFFLAHTQAINAQWQLLRLYASSQQNELLGVAVVLAGDTCFWVPEQSSFAGSLCSAIFELQPRRIVTTPFGRDLLHTHIGHQVSILREYDQWIMVSTRRFPQTSSRLAITSDIPRLVEYQYFYNQERSVDEVPDWESLIQQAKVVVHEFDRQIVSIVRFGIETHRLVNIGGTYTFPAYRRQGYAESVLAFAVNQIVESGRTAHLVVDVDNTSAIELYRQMGFECIGSSYVGYLEY